MIPGSRVRALACCGLLAAVACGGPKQDLSEQQLSAAVDAQRPSLERCYQSAPTGAVSGVELEGQGGLPGMSPCIKQAISAWRFPEAKDATHTSLPLIFKPQVQKPQVDPAAMQRAVQDALQSQQK